MFFIDAYPGSIFETAENMQPLWLPAVVISSPELCIGLAPRITAATGMDAQAHKLEAFCAPGFHPLVNGIAGEAMRLIHDWLPIAVEDGKNLVATAFQKGLGAIYSLSHPVGAIYNTHHGETNEVVMPYVLVLNRTAIEERLMRLARYLGLPNPGFTAVLDSVLVLRKQIGIPHTLAELGVRESDPDRLTPMAVDDPSIGGNPVPVGAREMRRMFEMSIRGDLG